MAVATTRTLTDLAKRNIIVRSGNGYALAASVQGYCKHLRDLATGCGGRGCHSDSHGPACASGQRASRAVALKNARLRGALLDAGAVEAEWSRILRNVRAALGGFSCVAG